MTDNTQPLGDGEGAPPLVLVDGSSYLFRAFHALPDLRTLDGFPTGAVRGVIAMLRKLMDDFAGSPVAVVFDAGGRTFRDDIYAEYKANRPPMSDDLRVQIEPIHDIIRAMGLPLLHVAGVEADDVIGTLAAEATASARKTVISTGDKDMAQLVSSHVTLVNTMTDTALDAVGVEEKYGVPPARIVDYLALMGDSVDNIPGVPKVGPKTAAKWLTQFGTLDDVIARADEVKGKVGENLRGALDTLPMSRDLATIRCDLELDFTIADLESGEPDTERLVELFERFDFQAWAEELGGGRTVELAREYPVLESLDALNELLAKARSAGHLALGVETGPGRFMDAQPVGFALGVAGDDVAYVPVGHDLVVAQGQLSLGDVVAAAKPVLEDPNVAKTGQDLKHARNILEGFGVALAGIANDTMLESYVLDSVGARRHQLQDLAQKYLGAQPVSFEDVAGKGAKQLGLHQVGVAEAAGYAAGSVDAACRLHEVLRPKLEQEGRLAEVYEAIELPLVDVLSKMERAGALVDRDLLRNQSHALSERMEELSQKAFSEAGHEFNLGSPKQLQEILYDEMELPALGKTRKGQRSTAEDVLVQLASYGHALPQLILDHRAASKLKSTYTDSLPHEINQRTGRIHTSYNQAVAATGRLSSADPNLQNIPIRTADGRQIRQAFVAPPGRRLIAADYSQIELRIMAHLSGDEGLLRAFETGQDIHRATAAEVFRLPLEEVSDDQRRSAKAINFGLIYGMSSFGLAKQLDVTRRVAQEYIDRYFLRYPGVAAYMDEVRGQAREAGFVETVFGRRLYLPDIRARQAPRRQAAERTAINAPMQGTAADIIKRAMIEVDGYLAELRDGGVEARMIMQVHDELVLEVDEGQVEAVKAGVMSRMEAAADLSVPLLVEAGVGYNWDEAH
ncbi:MAG: DNA polymerase I [Gammaproteobacteria bacterium]|nr:DNA polymerase I [Gammaproteobacteria bacterium]